jgi:hypothetical protein
MSLCKVLHVSPCQPGELTLQSRTTLLVVLYDNPDNQPTVILAMEGRGRKHGAQAVYQSDNPNTRFHRRPVCFVGMLSI